MARNWLALVASLLISAAGLGGLAAAQNSTGDAPDGSDWEKTSESQTGEEPRYAAGEPAYPAKPHPAPDPECEKALREHDERARAFHEAQASRRKEFSDKQAREYRSFAAENHTDEEWKAFKEHQATERAAFEDDLSRKEKAFREKQEADLRARCKSEPKPRPSIQPHPDPCREKFEAVHEEMEALMRRGEARHREFQQEFDVARENFTQSEHSEEEWQAFAEKWKAAAKALAEEVEAGIRALMEKHGLQSCKGAHSQPVAPARPPKEAEEPRYQPMPAEPVYRDDADRAALEIRKRCEAKVQLLYEDYERSRANGTGNYSDAESRAIKERIWTIQAECEAEIRVLYESRARHAKETEKQTYGSFEMYWDEENNRIVVKGKHMSLIGLPEAQTMTEITLDGQLFVDRLYAKGYLAEFRPEQTELGSAIEVFDSEGQRILSLHDNPRGVINLASSRSIPAVVLDLADYLKVERTEGGLRFTDGAGEGKVLLHGGDLSLADGNVLVLKGKATFLVASAEAATEPEPVEEAILAKKVGAEVVVVDEDGELKADATPYGDLEVRVTKVAEGKVAATCDSPSGTGKTVVLKFDTGLFGSSDLRVAATAVSEDGTESGLGVREASSLEDVLDPLDDGDVVEYWIVEDRNGLQVLVSFPHFSEKRVTMQSADDSDIVSVPGFEGALATLGLGLVAVVYGARRRLH